MHLADGELPHDYLGYTYQKVLFILGGIVLLFVLLIVSIAVGAVSIPPVDVIMTLIGQNVTDKWDRIIWNIRLPQALTAIVAGAGLSVAGVAMQSILRNPLASPFTLGISNAGAFGAAVAVIIFGTGLMTSTTAGAVVINNPYLTTITAFAFCMLATVAIIAIAKIKASSPEVVVLAGVALSSLFTAGVMFLQYFADDTQLAAVVHWTFGDVGRAGWPELTLMAVITIAACIYFVANRWNYNAMDAGDETARALGVNVER
ncbi:MAG TPA: iron ABC transporter permease, partial [Methanoregulaceae archaeon]|nr:iron ABC transporter permease [Methanoregulaceae archaeon]